MDISIVIVNWNTKDDLRAAIRSCYAHSGALQVEVTVVDNGSGDGSPDMVRREFPQAALLANDDNIGYVAAANQGMRRATGRYYLMLNSDAELTAGCLQELVRIMDTYPDIGTAGAQLIYQDGSPQPSGNVFLTVSMRLLPPALMKRAERLTGRASATTDGFYEIDWVLGACQIVRAETVAQVGLMDERIYMWWDDADWCLRMAKAGWRRVIAVNAVCIHHERRSAQALPPLRFNLQMSMSEFAYFRIHHGRAKTAVLWAFRTLYSVVKVLLLALAWVLTLGRVRRIGAMLRFNWGRTWFHLRHAADILCRDPKPYRGEKVDF